MVADYLKLTRRRCILCPTWSWPLRQQAPVLLLLLEVVYLVFNSLDAFLVFVGV
jgi:hypothetical protein